MSVLALDIGGANLKASDGAARSLSRPFPLWRDPDGLARELASIITEFDAVDRIAVTMTGELADCFETKADGVNHILSAVEAAAEGRSVAVWQTGGEFVGTQDARELVPLVAAANWHALATWAARMPPAGAGLLIDMGSTTTDLIPFVDGLPDTVGRTDLERLLSGELLYLGVRRTPLCAVASEVPFRDGVCPLAAELFAATLDVWLLTGDIAESPDDCHTANGRPATRNAAQDRLARMLCCDREEFSLDDALSAARALAARMQSRLTAAIERVARALPELCSAVVTTGEGEFLIHRALADASSFRAVPRLSLQEVLGPEHSSAACAYALAKLSMERAWPE